MGIADPRRTEVRSSARLVVLYDGDCGICTSSARLLRRLDRGGRLDLRPLDHALPWPDSPGAAALRDALHVRDASGRWASGGAAIVRVCAEVPWLRPLSILATVPGLRRLVEPSYAVVARNRHRLSRWLGVTACPIDQPNRR